MWEKRGRIKNGSSLYLKRQHLLHHWPRVCGISAMNAFVTQLRDPINSNRD